LYPLHDRADPPWHKLAVPQPLAQVRRPEATSNTKSKIARPTLRTEASPSSDRSGVDVHVVRHAPVHTVLEEILITGTVGNPMGAAAAGGETPAGSSASRQAGEATPGRSRACS